MIITRTPFRISFAGGGTDLRSYYHNDYGQVLSTSINKYIYVVVKKQIGVVEKKYRINWSRVESTNNIKDIQHPIVRSVLQKYNIDFPIQISTYADIPPNTGLGSSSAFTVGLVHAIYSLLGKMVSKYQIASEAAEIEVDILQRNMGKQDHFVCAYGSLNIFKFFPDETVEIEPVLCKPKVIKKIEDNTLLFYTSIKRNASIILKQQNNFPESTRENLTRLRDLSSNLRSTINKGTQLNNIGKILHKSWLIKKNISKSISSKKIDNYYNKAIKAGATGGKILGAGGGGFILLYVDKDKQKKVIKSLADLLLLDYKFDNSGTRITYYDNNP